MLPVSKFIIHTNEYSDLYYSGSLRFRHNFGRARVKVLIFLTCAIASLFFAQLVFANSLAADGQKLAQITKEIDKLEAQNTTLKVKIAQESSLASLSQEAQDLGFVKPAKIITP